ncbi:lysine 5,6-aminomutase reactivase subunit KamB [Fusibacter sp. JL298sf-3]
MDIYSLIKDRYSIISIVGMAKNAGKTVALNHLIDCIEAPIGLTSIGRDGERQDLVTQTDKPMIYVGRGTYVATAEALFHLSEAKMEVVEMTPFESAMGRIVIGRTLNDGYIQIGGPSTNKAVRAVAEKMLAYGAAYVLVDGALDRTSSASPAITDACVLATGAVLSRMMDKAVKKTVHQATLLKLDYHGDAALSEVYRTYEATHRVVLCDEDGCPTPLSGIKTALDKGREIAQHITEKTRVVIVYGALVYQTVFDIIHSTQHYKQLTFVVGDATKIFIDEQKWAYLARIGINVCVETPINLIALTVNPYAPAGYFYDSSLFRERLSKALAPLPVLDVMEGA